MATFDVEAWETFALGLTGAVYGDRQAVNAALLDTEVPLSTVVCVSYAAIANLLATVAASEAVPLEELLPDWLAFVREAIGIDQ